MMHILETDDENLENSLYLTFTVQFESFGETREHELIVSKNVNISLVELKSMLINKISISMWMHTLTTCSHLHVQSNLTLSWQVSKKLVMETSLKC
jgi:hypothetical protein